MSTNQNKQNHNYFMRLALQQAEKILGNTKDNPAVGCIITKDKHVIGAGATSINGRPHAEHNAINFSKIKLKNSQIYVTLEPCAHFGRTSPCINKIIKKKIKRVYFSIKDPDPRTYNKSSKRLRERGIVVSNGLLIDKTKPFYSSYIIYKKRKLPYLTCKIAISKDFYTINKKNRCITNEFSRGRVQLMRSLHDCIITSSKTIIKDNPRLTCRIEGLKNRSPSRIIFDNKLRLGIKTNIIKESKIHRTIIFYNKTNKQKIKLLKKLKIKLFKIPLDNYGDLDLIKALVKTKELGFSRIFLESGIKLATNFLNNDLVDCLKIYISNKNLGENGDYSLKKYLKIFLRNKKKTIEKVNLLGDKLISYKLK